MIGDIGADVEAAARAAGARAILVPTAAPAARRSTPRREVAATWPPRSTAARRPPRGAPPAIGGADAAGEPPRERVTHVLAVRLDNDGDVLLAGPAIRALAAGADRGHAAVRPARAPGGRAAARRRRGPRLARAVDRPRAGARSIAAAVDALVDRLAALRRRPRG